MPFTGHENHHISLQEARSLTSNYRKSVSSGSELAGYFSRDAILAILNQASCVGIRIYRGLSADNLPRFVIVGVDSAGQDLTGGELAEFSHNCPPFCDPASALMTD